MIEVSRAVRGFRLRTLSARWMSCLRPGPASERTFTIPALPPICCDPIPVFAWPLTTSCLLAGSNQMLLFSASNSSVVSQSFARSQSHGGSVTCASQSKVGKFLVIGANFWTGIAPPPRLFGFQPRVRHRVHAVAREDRIDLLHVGVRYRPSDRAHVVLHFALVAASDQRRADDGIRERPAQRELRQRLAVAQSYRFQLFDRTQIFQEMVGTEQMLEQVDIPQPSAPRAPIVRSEIHLLAHRAGQDSVGE